MSMIGTVLRFDPVRGYGFVAPLDGSPDLFVHESGNLAGEPLMKGDKISFDKEFDTSKNKMMAVNCQIAEYSPSRGRQSYISCVSDQSRLSAVSPMHHFPGMMSPWHSPQNGLDQQQFFQVQQLHQQQHQQQHQQHQFLEQPQMIDNQLYMQQQQQQQQQQNFVLSPTTITTVFVEDVNMMQ